MLLFIRRLFTWWDGATFGALFDIGRRAKKVGEDEYGNRYFQERKISLEGRPRRYVIYKGYADASRVPPDWHGWLHHTVNELPAPAKKDEMTGVRVMERQPWEKDHQPNLTGTLHAYHPKGSLARPGDRAAATGDYEAWAPDS